MSKLSSFIVTEAEDLASACYHNGVIKTRADLRDMVSSQAVKDAGLHDFIRYSPVRKPEASKTHPTKSINGAIVY